MYNCRPEKMEKVAPDVSQIEYGPFELYNKNLVIDPNSWTYFTYEVDKGQYDFCYYDIKLQSKARLFDLYIIPKEDYQSFKDGDSYSYYYREEEVASVQHSYGRSDSGEFNVIVKNDNDNSMTIVTSIKMRCFKE